MPTANIAILGNGTGFSVNVTTMGLSTDLTLKDFVVLKAGVVEPLSNYVKVSATQINYAGVSLVNAPLEFRRMTPTSVITTAQFGTRIRSEDWNNELDRVSRRAEEYALNGVGAGSLVTTSLPQNDAFGVLWSTDIIFPPNRKVVYDKIITLANIASPTFTGVVTLPTVADADSSLKAATTLFVKNNLLTFAPIASPTFTGTPVLPSATVGVTQTAGDNTTKLATTAFVQGLLVSPAFTVSPTAPTQTRNDNTTKLATTAYVNTSNRPYFEATEATGGQSMAHGVFTTFIASTENLDLDNVYNPATGTFTVPTGAGGLYLFTVGMFVTVGNNNMAVNLYVNGVDTKRVVNATNGNGSLVIVTGTGTLRLVAGDVVTARLYHDNTPATARVISANTQINYFTGCRLNIG